MINKYVIFFSFFISIIFPPLVFANLTSSNFRAGLFAIFLGTLILKLFPIMSSKLFIVLSKYWIHLLCLLVYLIIIILRWAFFNIDFSISFGYFLVLLVPLLFHIIFFYDNERFTSRFIKTYIYFFNIICYSIIINFLFNLIYTINIDILSSLFTNENYEYNVSIFGISIDKFFGPINVSRNFFFFIEPVFTSTFFILNIFYISKCLTGKHKSRFALINLLAGILTFSFLFFILLIFVFFSKSISKFKLKQLLVGIPVVSLLGFFVFTIFDSSSFLERSIRFQAALEEISAMKFVDYIFGFGYLKEYSLDRGFSAGILNLLLEGGAIIYFIVIYFLYSFSSSRVLFIICIVSLFVFEPNKFPFFWLSYIISSYVFRSKIKLSYL